MQIPLKALLAASALVSTLTWAGTPVLGFELGISTLSQVKSKLQAAGEVLDKGVNQYSRGPMLATDGHAYGIEGLNSVVYIFDQQHKLAGVVMTLGKDRFPAVFEFVGAKYKVKSQSRPFVGDQEARFETADAEIQLNAPHLSFEMQARYVSKDLLAAFRRQSAEERKAKSASEASKF